MATRKAAKKTSTRKKTTRKKAARKKATRKKATRKKTTRKKTTRKKATRKKATRKKATRKKAQKPAEQRVKIAKSQQTGYKLQDDQVEQALTSGEHRDMLEAYFGEAAYSELASLAAKARSRARRGGPRVLVLPGIMGSKLGKRGFLFDDTIWFDPIDVARGKLESLSLKKKKKKKKIVPLGVFLLAYLKLKLSLAVRGFDTSFHPFDWRKDLVELGDELKQRILDETKQDRPLSIVAHSMGGLVARSAIKLLGSREDRVRRLIMLGTPNHGSFAPVQALRGVYPVVRKVAKLDLSNDAEDLARKVFSTLPGLYQMLPFRETFPAVDLYDMDAWPRKGPRPDSAILRAAPKSQARLAPGTERMVMIAGVGQETTTGAAIKDGAFEYTLSMAGDGTVPLASARLPGVKTTYYVEESHGSLPNNTTVERAVADILETGATTRLAKSWPMRRGAGTWKVAESEIPDPFADMKRGDLSASDGRNLLQELAAPIARGDVPTLAPGAALRIHGTSSEPIVVGRRRQHRLDLYLAHGSVTEVSSRAIVLGLFRDVAPSGPARAIDGALDGAITEFTTRRMFNGKVGEVFLFPSGRQRVRADLVGFVGLGAFDEFSEDVLRLASENIVRTLTRTHVRDFATVLMGSGSVTTLRDSLRCLIEGVFQGIKDVDSRSRLRSVTLCEMDTQRYEAMKSELLALSTTSLFDEVEVTLEEVAVPDAPEVIAGPAVGRDRLFQSGPDPIYVVTREEHLGRSTSLYRASVLAGGKATVVSDTVEVDRSALTDHLETIETLDFNSLAEFGTDLAKLVLPESVAGLIAQSRRSQATGHSPIVVIHDAPTSRIPWETMCLDGKFVASGPGISRMYAADNMSVAKWLDERRMGTVLDLLLIVNPLGDLDGADLEGARVREQFESNPRVRIHELRHEEATWTAVKAAFSSGEFDMVHYAGHAEFNAQNRRKSGILCHGYRVLSGSDLAGLDKLPALVFFNACESARVRGAKRGKQKRKKSDVIDHNVGLAEAFLRGGIASYVGTYWPVGDAGATKFCEVFYDELLAGRLIGAALAAGRERVRKLRSVDWADYVHYGNPNFVLKNPG